MKAIQIISQDLFDKIRSRFTNLEMGDQDGGVTIDPAEARFFDFDFMLEGKNLGRVSVSLNDPGSLKLYYSQGITETLDDDVKKMWYGFLKEMRFFAMRRLLRFDTRDVAKTNLDKNDFQYLANKKPKEEDAMKMNESRWNRVTKKTSRAVKGTTEVIVRHKAPVNEMLPADRSRTPNISAIFIQNKEGERFKTPFNYLPLAFALAQHIDHGGVPHDAPARKMIGMCEEIAKLQSFRKLIKSSMLHDDNLQIHERAVGRLQELKATLEALGKRRNYESWVAEFNETEMMDDDLTELSPVQFEEYKSKFTQVNFNEELAEFFPLIHKIMQEKVDLEDYVQEELKGNQHKLDVDKDGDIEGDDLADLRAGQKEGFENFEEWAEAVGQGQLSPEQVNDLKAKLPTLTLVPDGSMAFSEITTSLGVSDEEAEQGIFKDLQDRLDSTAQNVDSDSEGKVQEIFVNWAQENDVYPELVSALAPQQQLTPEPETGMQPAPKPEPGVNPNATPSPETGMNPAPKPGQPVAEGKNSLVQEIAEIVKRFFNEDNEEVAPFRSEESVCLEVEKTISEKYDEKTGQQARMLAEKFIQKLTQQWESKHGKSKEELGPQDQGDGLSIGRLQELIGSLKAKVENYEESQGSDVEEVSQKNFNPHDDLAGRGRLSSLNKTDAGKKADFDRGTERLKDKMTFSKKMGGVAGPKGDLPEMADIKKLAGLTK